jgi:hypothetical protein
VLSWAGARGVVPLAAALSIPLTDDVGAAVPFRDLVQVIAIAVIVISLVVQGFTLAPLVRLTDLAIAPDPPPYPAPTRSGGRPLRGRELSRHGNAARANQKPRPGHRSIPARPAVGDRNAAELWRPSAL